MTFEKRMLAGIPAQVITPEGAAANLPTVLLYHGWSGSVENYRFFGTMLARFGYQVILPEIPMHGERGTLPLYYGPEGFAHFWDVMNGGVQEGQAIVRELTTTGLADPKRLGIVGHSLGGGIATGIFAQSDAAALVTINGASAYEYGETLWRQALGRPEATDDDLQPLREYDPMRFTDRFAPRPVLFLHGDADTQVPIQVGETLHAALKPHYADHQELLRFATTPRLNHYITLSMLEETVNWLNTHIANLR